MKNQWHEPFKISEWVKRSFSILNMTCLLIAAVFLLSEFRLDWCERITGNYIATSNSTRPETGIIWKTGKQASNAHLHLNDIIQNRQNTERKAKQASSFSDLAQKLLPGQWANLDETRFKQFYLAMPDSVAKKIIRPVELVWVLSSKNIKRIFCEGKSNGMEIYFLDQNNRVIHQINFNKPMIDQAEKEEAPFKGRLNDIKEFEGHIYPADIFFKAVLSLPREMISSLIINPRKLLMEKGKIIKAGISNEAQSGYIKMGFEFNTGNSTVNSTVDSAVNNENGSEVVFIKGREWAVWRLNMLLAGEKK